MGKSYGHLDLKERIEIYRLHADGKSVRCIGAMLGRSPSTISRELRRNSVATKAWPGGYVPDRAQALAERRRRWDCRYKLARQPALRALVSDRLAMGWSPQQIAGRLARLYGHTVISHESIYRYVYYRSAQKDYWHRLLPRRKSRRGRLGMRGGSPVDHIHGRVSISERPASVADRRCPGHWEADLMLFARYGQAILVSHERTSRLLLVHRQPNKTADPIAERLISQFRTLPKSLRRTITFDNGTEFARHHRLTEQLGIATYFCDPHKPWQKGGIENAIGRMRRALPRNTDLATLSHTDINNIAAAYNSTPRKCLDYKTPAEVFYQIIQPLHFKREPTSPPSRG